MVFKVNDNPNCKFFQSLSSEIQQLTFERINERRISIILILRFFLRQNDKLTKIGFKKLLHPKILQFLRFFTANLLHHLSELHFKHFDNMIAAFVAQSSDGIHKGTSHKGKFGTAA